jgi:hypothetical protein
LYKLRFSFEISSLILAAFSHNPLEVLPGQVIHLILKTMLNIDSTGLLLSSSFPKVSGFERISSISWESLSVSCEFALSKYRFV